MKNRTKDKLMISGILIMAVVVIMLFVRAVYIIF